MHASGYTPSWLHPEERACLPGPAPSALEAPPLRHFVPPRDSSSGLTEAPRAKGRTQPALLLLFRQRDNFFLSCVGTGAKSSLRASGNTPDRLARPLGLACEVSWRCLSHGKAGVAEPPAMCVEFLRTFEQLDVGPPLCCPVEGNAVPSASASLSAHRLSQKLLKSHF